MSSRSSSFVKGLSFHGKKNGRRAMATVRDKKLLVAK